VLLAFAVGQAAVQIQSPIFQLTPDSPEYVVAARHILGTGQFLDPLRTPGYPTFLALIFALTGGEHYRAVVLAQIGLLLAATLEVYALAWRIWGRRALAAAVAVMLACNPVVANYERDILAEVFAYWLVVTVYLAFEGYLRDERGRRLIGVALLCAVTILTRPQFLYLPALLIALLALRSLRRGDLRRHLGGYALACAVAYGPALAYIVGNGLVYGYVGLSEMSNLNLFGKVLEYHLYAMPDAGTDPRLVHFQADVLAFLARHGREAAVGQVWEFVFSHPQYDAHHWAIYGTYSSALIRHHPFDYLRATGGEVINAWLAPPLSFAAFPTTPWWVAVLLFVAIAGAQVYAFLPLLLVQATVKAWRQTDSAPRMLLLAMLLAVASDIVFCAATDFTEFGRLRYPLDWAMLAAFAAVLVAVVQRAAVGLATLRSGAHPVSSQMAGHTRAGD
jgi:4-amino-4-deoxy-L-arabinose transferase-like glycosyltransferase